MSNAIKTPEEILSDYSSILGVSKFGALQAIEAYHAQFSRSSVQGEEDECYVDGGKARINELKAEIKFLKSQPAPPIEPQGEVKDQFKHFPPDALEYAHNNGHSVYKSQPSPDTKPVGSEPDLNDAHILAFEEAKEYYDKKLAAQQPVQGDDLDYVIETSIGTSGKFFYNVWHFRGGSGGWEELIRNSGFHTREEAFKAGQNWINEYKSKPKVK